MCQELLSNWDSVLEYLGSATVTQEMQGVKNQVMTLCLSYRRIAFVHCWVPGFIPFSHEVWSGLMCMTTCSLPSSNFSRFWHGIVSKCCFFIVLGKAFVPLVKPFNYTIFSLLKYPVIECILVILFVYFASS